MYIPNVQQILFLANSQRIDLLMISLDTFKSFKVAWTSTISLSNKSNERAPPQAEMVLR